MLSEIVVGQRNVQRWLFVQGKTRLGGQKKTWRTVVEKDLKLIEIPVEVTRDRKEWRKEYESPE